MTLPSSLQLPSSKGVPSEPRAAERASRRGEAEAELPSCGIRPGKPGRAQDHGQQPHSPQSGEAGGGGRARLLLRREETTVSPAIRAPAGLTQRVGGARGGGSILRCSAKDPRPREEEGDPAHLPAQLLRRDAAAPELASVGQAAGREGGEKEGWPEGASRRQEPGGEGGGGSRILRGSAGQPPDPRIKWQRRGASETFLRALFQALCTRSGAKEEVAGGRSERKGIPTPKGRSALTAAAERRLRPRRSRGTAALRGSPRAAAPAAPSLPAEAPRTGGSRWPRLVLGRASGRRWVPARAARQRRLPVELRGGGSGSGHLRRPCRGSSGEGKGKRHAARHGSQPGVRPVRGFRAPEGAGRARHGYRSGLCCSPEAPSPPLERPLLSGCGRLTQLCNHPEAAEEMC